MHNEARLINIEVSDDLSGTFQPLHIDLKQINDLYKLNGSPNRHLLLEPSLPALIKFADSMEFQ